jgi:hypothetical protein
MNQQPDKLFRDKLESFSRPAPASAWDKIEAGLDKKNNTGGIGWKVAASLLILIVAGYILWTVLHNSTTPSQQLVNKDKQQPQQSIPQKNAEHTPAPDSTEKSNTGVYTESVTQPVQKTESVTTDKYKQQPEQTTTPLPVDDDAATQPELVAEVITPQPAAEEVPAIAVVETPDVAATQHERAVATQQSITLVFSADETDNYLNKNLSAEATDEEQKPSTFKKLLKKAQDLKNNQDPVGELRQKKNEILALNFKNEKRGQNK